MLSARPTTISSCIHACMRTDPTGLARFPRAKGTAAPYDADDNEPQVERVLKGGHGEAQVRKHAGLWRWRDTGPSGRGVSPRTL